MRHNHTKNQFSYFSSLFIWWMCKVIHNDSCFLMSITIWNPPLNGGGIYNLILTNIIWYGWLDVTPMMLLPFKNLSEQTVRDFLNETEEARYHVLNCLRWGACVRKLWAACRTEGNSLQKGRALIYTVLGKWILSNMSFSLEGSCARHYTTNAH